MNKIKENLKLFFIICGIVLFANKVLLFGWCFNLV
jgi:hypothetical protein